jgi:hypothetical protein
LTGTKSGVWDAGGVFSDEYINPQKLGDLTRRAPTAIVNFISNSAFDFSITTVDLNQKYSPHWYGTGEGPFRSAPGSHRVRRTSLHPQYYYQQILNEMPKW